MITGLPADLVDVQNAGHRVVPRLWTRTPKTGVWTELRVLTATVTYAPAGEYPGRSVEATVLLEAEWTPPPPAPVLDATNPATNPALEGGTLTGWLSVAANYVLSLDTTAPIAGTRSAMTTRAATTLDATAGAITVGADTTNHFVVAPGTPVQASIEVKTELAGRRIRALWQWYNVASGGTPTNSTVAVLLTSTVAGQVNRVTATGTPPAGMIGARLRILVDLPTGTVTAGERVWFDRFRFGGSDYFDGSTAAAPPYTFRWTGTANASSSERLRQDDPVTTLIPNVTEPTDAVTVDWLTAPLSPYGGWVKVQQDVYRMDGTIIEVPWGVYRVESINVNELAATVQIEGADGSAQVADRPFVTVGQSKIGATQNIGTKMTEILNGTFPAGILPFWTAPILDLGGATDKAFGGKGAVYADNDRLDTLAILGAKLLSGSRLIFPRTGSLAKLILPGGDTAPGEAYVIAKENLIFAEYGDIIERKGIFNEVVITYEKKVGSAYGQERIQQKRVIAQYVDTGEETAISGPFGYVTRDTTAVEIPEGTADPDTYAKDLALEAMGRSFSASRVVSVQSGPIYALEQGDVVYVQADAEGVRKQGILTGATIPLNADGGPWQLDVLMTDTLDANWHPRYQVKVDETQFEDNFTWKPLKAKTTVDLDSGRGSGKTKKDWRGWTVTNSSKTVGGTGLTATASGGNVTLYTSQSTWSENVPEHRYRAKASVTAPKSSIKARIGVDTNTQGIIWGPWKSFAPRKSQTISVDTKRLVNSGAVSFGIRIETSGMSSGEQVRMNSASVDRALRNKS